MWLRFTCDSGDCAVNMNTVRKIRPNGKSSETVLSFDDTSLVVLEPFEEVWSRILSYQEPVEITVEGSPAAFDPVGQATPTPGP